MKKTNGSIKYGRKLNDLWSNMHKRVASREGYADVTIAADWYDFEIFRRDIEELEGYQLWIDGEIRMALDKDLLGGKEYSKETCVFLPASINSFLSHNKSTNESGVTGAAWHKRKNKWQVRIQEFGTGRSLSLGYFEDINDAAKAYTEARMIQAVNVKSFMIELGYNYNVIDIIK